MDPAQDGTAPRGVAPLGRRTPGVCCAVQRVSRRSEAVQLSGQVQHESRLLVLWKAGRGWGAARHVLAKAVKSSPFSPWTDDDVLLRVWKSSIVWHGGVSRSGAERLGPGSGQDVGTDAPVRPTRRPQRFRNVLHSSTLANVALASAKGSSDQHRCLSAQARPPHAVAYQAPGATASCRTFGGGCSDATTVTALKHLNFLQSTI